MTNTGSGAIDLLCSECKRNTSVTWSGMCPECYRRVFGVESPVVIGPPSPDAAWLFEAMRVEVWNNAIEMAALAIEAASDKQECYRRIRALRRSPQATEKDGGK